MNKALQILCVYSTLTLAFYASFVAATCGGCMSNGVACLNEREFTTCYKGETTQNLVSCGKTERCTASSNICEPIESNIPEVCPFTGPCNICTHSNGRFACVNETHYGFCFGRYTPDLNAIGKCPENFVCSTLAIKDICVPTDQHKPSCLNVPAPVTLKSDNPISGTNPVENDETPLPDFFKQVCEILGFGPHPYPRNCKSFYTCHKVAGELTVKNHDCPISAPYFDRQLKACKLNPLSGCTS